MERWLHLVERLMNIQIFKEPDSFTWHLTPFGVFTVKSLYEEYMNEDTRYLEIFVEVGGTSKDYNFYVVPSQKGFTYKGQPNKTELTQLSQDPPFSNALMRC
jgi:hypothetical protein